MELTKTQINAMEMLFDDQLTDIAVAEQVGVDVRTLRRWQQLPEFTAELASLHADYRKRVRERCLLVRLKRVGMKLDRYAALNRLIVERANNADPTVPGDNTGLILKRIINTKSGVLIEARVDHATLRELSRLENEIAWEVSDETPRVVIDNAEMSRDLALTAPTVDPDEPQRGSSFLNRAARRRAQKRSNHATNQAINLRQTRALANAQQHTYVAD
jgi:hypothetical protein